MKQKRNQFSHLPSREEIALPFSSIVARLAHVLTTTIVILLAVIGVSRLATIGSQGQRVNPVSQARTGSPNVAAKPFFSLSTHRTYGTGDRVRFWINYRAVDHLDFRVYRVKDPLQFFKQLDDPHQMGDQDKGEVVSRFPGEPSLLERLREFKQSVRSLIKAYFRSQLRRETRVTFNQTVRGESQRMPLNVADYARIPLLNPDQLVASWRELLPAPEQEYNSRTLTLGQRGPGLYLIEAVNAGLRAYTLAIVTELTLINKTAPDGAVVVCAVERKSGAPRQGVGVEVARAGKTLVAGATDNNGILRSQISKASSSGLREQAPEDFDPEATRRSMARNSYLIMARQGDHFAISDLGPYFFGGYAGEDPHEGEDAQNVMGYVYTDRPVYRPEQKVYFRGLLRLLDESGYRLTRSRFVNVTLEDPNNKKLLEKELELSARGTFHGEVELSSGAPLGGYRITVVVGRARASGYFEVQEYKKPEYKVTVTTPGKFVPVGETAKFLIEARYFFGEPVSRASVKYYIYRSRYYHSWWRDQADAGEFMSEEGGDDGYYGYGSDMVQEGEESLDANGRLNVEFRVPAPGEKESWDYTYRLEAQVTDGSRRVIDGKASFVGTRGTIVATASPERYVYYQGDNARIRVRTADYEGHPASARLTLKFVEQRWEKIRRETEGKYAGYEYKLRERELASADLQTNSQGEANYEYRVSQVGSIAMKVLVQEGDKQVAFDAGYLWIADRSNQWSDLTYRDYGSIKLVADKASYVPGETAHVLAMLPTDQAHLFATTELFSISTARQIDATGRAVMIDVPIQPSYTPNVYFSVSYVKNGELYTSDKILNVPARDKLLSVEIIPNKAEYKPRETASYALLVRNSDGTPAPGAEVSLGVVDEAIYSVRSEQVQDIRRAFYGRRYNRVLTHFSISYYFSGFSGGRPLELARRRASYQLADFKNESQYARPTIRKDFRDTAYWQPSLLTGVDGKATVQVRLPDNLTTWRATARAVTADTRVGSGMGRAVARKDLILRLETPRFLTEGDTVTISGIVHNYLQTDKTARISLETSGARLLDLAAQTVVIPRRGEQRIDWRVTAPQVGQMNLLAKALTDTESDAVETILEVVPQGLRQTSGGTATLSEEKAEETLSLNLPPSANEQARALRIEASPSIAGALFGALDYLTGYPYGCVEQTMSRFLPNVIVSQTLKEIQLTSVRADNELDTKVQRGLERLYDHQHDGGGWGWWKNDPSDPFMTAYVVDGLTLAGKVGYAVEKYRIERGRERLRSWVESAKTEDGKTIDLDTLAYLTYVVNESGSLDKRPVEKLYAKRKELQPYGRALLALTLQKRGEQEGARQLAQDIERSARANEFDAHWESRLRPMLDFSEVNDLEATALSLRALVRISPQSPLLPKVARWLVANRENGFSWLSTKQTAFVIFALTDYLKVSQELSPDYTLELYLNGVQVLTRQVTAADVRSAQAFVVERTGAEVSPNSQVKVIKRGKGLLYLAATVSYFTRQDEVAPQSSTELKLTREYLRLRVTENGGSPKWAVEPMSGQLRSGDLIVCRLRVQGARAQYLMIEDPIPAGCEQVERVSGISLDYTQGRWSDWYSAREFRDQKTALFVNYFYGESVFQYALPVLVPGEFRVVPARAELMYQPTVQANTGATSLRIVEK